MWFISHNAKELLISDSTAGAKRAEKKVPSQTPTPLLIAEGEAFGFATRPSTAAIE
jgi:hypothetical protein